MTQKKYTVLVIEDESLLLRAITLKLEKLGLEVVSATSGEQALSYLVDLPQLPDIIWLDYYLGNMTGLDFLHELKKNSNYSRIPVVVVSNSASDEKVKNMLALGVKKYILKAEYRLEDIVQVIHDILKENSI